MQLIELAINEEIKKNFITHLEEMKIYKMYASMFKNLNANQTTIFLSAYNKQDYMNRDRLYHLYRTLKLNGSTYQQIYSQLLKYSQVENLDTLKKLLPDIGVDILELIYLTPDHIAYLITQQIAELKFYEPELQVKVTEETLRVYIELSKRYLIFTSNFTKLFKDNQALFDPTLPDAWNIEIAKRVVYLQKTLHQLKGTRICILDIETTGLTKPRPIQISFLLFDMNFNFIKSYNRYIKQEHIEQSATTASHGITVQMLHNELPSVDPEEAYDEIHSLLNDDKVLFVAHNANFDIRVLNNFVMQCTGTAGPQLRYICTYRNYDQFSDMSLNQHSLSALLVRHGIKDQEIFEQCNKLFQIEESGLKFHNAVVDVTALYMFIKKSKFFTNV